MQFPLKAWPLAWTLVLSGGAHAATLAADPAAVKQLVDAVSLDVMTEAALQACDDVGAAATPQMRAAWVAWRERHQIAPLRVVVMALQRRQGSSAPSWKTITEPMRQRVLGDAAPDAACAGLASDLQGAGMDVSAHYPQARAVAAALVQAKLVTLPGQPAIVPGAARGQVLLPCQIPALLARQGRGWSAISEEAAAHGLGPVHARGRVERWGSDGDRFRLIQEQGDRRCEHHIYLGFNAEPWVGRELVLRGLVTSLSGTSITLSGAALVGDASGLAPYPLAQKPLARREVLLQRVLSPCRG